LASTQGSHTLAAPLQLASSLNAAIGVGTLTVSGPVTGSGGLVKSGAGVLALNGTNTYTGTTTVSSGVLRVGGALSGPGFSITVAPSGRLEASGSISRDIPNSGVVAGPTDEGQKLRLSGVVFGTGDYVGNVAMAGVFSPGNSAASVDFANAEFESTATLMMEIGGLSEGTQYDHLEIASAATLGGTLLVSLINGFAPQAGDEFNLFDWASTAGAFGRIELPELPDLAWDVSKLSTAGVLSVVWSADFDANGSVNEADRANWTAGFGAATGAVHADGDSDGDADVDGADFLAWQRQLGSASAPVAVIPEPPTWWCIAPLSAFALRRRPRCSNYFPRSGPRGNAASRARKPVTDNSEVAASGTAADDTGGEPNLDFQREKSVPSTDKSRLASPWPCVALPTAPWPRCHRKKSAPSMSLSASKSADGSTPTNGSPVLNLNRVPSPPSRSIDSRRFPLTELSGTDSTAPVSAFNRWIVEPMELEKSSLMFCR
jgi:autotransporter-associated beta strand protein